MNLSYKPKKLQKISEKSCSLEQLQQEIKEQLLEYAESYIACRLLEQDLFKNQIQYHQTISECIRNCCSGHYGARDTVMELIYGFLENKEFIQGIAFDKPELMTARQQLETLIYYFDRQKENRGFELLCKKFGWNKNGFVISENIVEKTYAKLIRDLSPEDKRHILTRIIFAETVGLGPVDTLNAQKGYIEEIQIGMSGKAEKLYDYRQEYIKKEGSGFFKEGIYVMAEGCTVYMKAISFETEQELQRVLRNLIKDANGGELTKKNPMIVADAPDGRRISVSRPPVTDTWIGLIRKFDTVQDVSLKKLYYDCPEGKILPELLQWIVRSGRNIAITGEMASGKTTLFRACLAEIKNNLNIRVIEADSFELNVRSFLPGANTVTMRVTEDTPADEVLAFARKTTGQVFAIGEINSASMAVVAMDLSKIASQLFFSAHYVTTEHMIADFVNAKLGEGGYKEMSPQPDVIRCLGFDIHLRVKQGRRYVQWINEVVPVKREFSDHRDLYEIRQIYQYDEEKEQGVIVNIPSEVTYDRAKQQMEKREYLDFVRFFTE